MVPLCALTLRSASHSLTFRVVCDAGASPSPSPLRLACLGPACHAAALASLTQSSLCRLSGHQPEFLMSLPLWALWALRWSCILGLSAELPGGVITSQAFCVSQGLVFVEETDPPASVVSLMVSDCCTTSHCLSLRVVSPSAWGVLTGPLLCPLGSQPVLLPSPGKGCPWPGLDSNFKATPQAFPTLGVQLIYSLTVSSLHFQRTVIKHSFLVEFGSIYSRTTSLPADLGLRGGESISVRLQ